MQKAFFLSKGNRRTNHERTFTISFTAGGLKSSILCPPEVVGPSSDVFFFAFDLEGDGADLTVLDRLRERERERETEGEEAEGDWKERRERVVAGIVSELRVSSFFLLMFLMMRFSLPGIIEHFFRS